MKRALQFHIITLILVLCMAGPTIGEETGANGLMRVTIEDNGVQVTEDNTAVLYYQRTPKSLEGKHERAGYVHPLHDLDGKVITEDFPKDHRHHRGVFWAWHQVWVGDKKTGDPWLCTDFIWDVQDVRTSSTDRSISIHADVQWKSPQHSDVTTGMIPIVQETTTITVHAKKTAHAKKVAYRLIDFEISLLALVNGVRIGGSEDFKGYGGFSPRIKLTDDVRFTAKQGELEPVTAQIAAGQWVNIIDRQRGLAILTHPKNPGKQGQWILRRKRSMQNPVYPGNNPVAVSMTQPTTLRYRLVIHQGDLPSEKIEELQQDYRDEPAK